MQIKTKQFKNLVYLAMLATMLQLWVSCSDNADIEVPVASKPTEARFSAKINAPATRVVGKYWEDGDIIGIFMLSDGGTLSNPEDILANNYKYVIDLSSYSAGTIADASDYLKHVDTNNGGSGAVYMQPEVAYDFVSYYPYIATSDLIDGYKYSIDLADQYTKKISQHDLLYATSTRMNVSRDAVNFDFNHALSNITIKVNRGKGIGGADYKAKNLVISGMPATATFDLSNGAINDYGVATEITSSKSDENGNHYEVIILPQEADSYSNRIFSFNISGREYFWSISDGFPFLSGKRYTYEFTISTDGLVLDGDVTISNWAYGGNYNSDEWDKGIEDKYATVDISSGSFLMGCAVGQGNEQNTRTVNITKGFKMSKYQVTVAEYCQYLNAGRKDVIVMKEITENQKLYREAWGSLPVRGAYKEDNYIVPSNIVNGQVLLARSNDWGITYDTENAKWSPVSPDFENHPMTSVTWYGAFAYAYWIGGRLPTEAEWEYACKADHPDDSLKPDDLNNNYGMGVSLIDQTITQINGDNLGDYAWYNSNNNQPASGYLPGIKQVGLRLPNAWGLYDMHGNTWEWCYDWYSGTYDTNDVENPCKATLSNATPDSNSRRVLRGGTYASNASDVRSSFRNSDTPNKIATGIGFRIVFP